MGTQCRLAREIAHRTGMDVKACVAVLREAADVIWAEWGRCRRVNYPGLGIFEPRYRYPRRVVSNLPGRKGEVHEIGTRKRLRFKPASNPVLDADYGRSFPRNPAANEPPEPLFNPEAARPLPNRLNPYLRPPRAVQAVKRARPRRRKPAAFMPLPYIPPDVTFPVIDLPPPHPRRKRSEEAEG